MAHLSHHHACSGQHVYSGGKSICMYICDIYIQYITVYCAPMFTSSYQAIIAINGGSTLVKVSLFTLSLSFNISLYSLYIFRYMYIYYICIYMCIYIYIYYTLVLVLMKQNTYSHSNPECE